MSECEKDAVVGGREGQGGERGVGCARVRGVEVGTSDFESGRTNARIGGGKMTDASEKMNEKEGI